METGTAVASLSLATIVSIKQHQGTFRERGVTTRVVTPPPAAMARTATNTAIPLGRANSVQRKTATIPTRQQIIDFLETESADFADQEEEAETIEDQEEETIVEQEESHFSEVEEIVGFLLV